MIAEPTGTTVYVALLDEGVDCWRPVHAVKLGEGIFRISEQEVPDEEVWEFRPGEVVRCDEYDFSDGRRLRAFARADKGTVPEHLAILEGWQPGMLKISLTKTLRGATGMGLAEAKACTDSVAAGRAVTLMFSSGAEADRFCCDVQKLGVVVRRDTLYR